MSELLCLHDFSPWLQESWSIQFTEEESLPAVLIKAKTISSYSPVDREPFSLVFRTDQKTEYYPQAVRILQHPVKGGLPVFLVPIGFDGQGMCYEAVFT